MASKLLEGVGVLAVLGLVAGSVAALLIVKDRINVTIAAEEAAAQRGPDPVELLRADVVALAGDVTAVNTNLAAAFQELHGALESAAAERDKLQAARIEALAAKLAALQAASSKNDAAFAAALDAQAKAIAEASLRGAPLDAASAPAPVAVVTVPAEGAPPASEVFAPPAEAPAAPPKKGFLGFQLPSESFAFDRRQRFAIVSSLSRVGFDAKSTLHDFSGVTSKVEGELTVNLAKPDEKPAAAISVDAASLDTGLADRDKDMRKTLAVEQHASIRFEWKSFTASAVDPKTMTVEGTAAGVLSIRGKSKDVTMPVKVSVDASKRLAIEGEVTIKLSEYDVSPPTQLGGTIKVDDELKLWIALRARCVGPAKEGE